MSNKMIADYFNREFWIDIFISLSWMETVFVGGAFVQSVHFHTSASIVTEFIDRF